MQRMLAFVLISFQLQRNPQPKRKQKKDYFAKSRGQGKWICEFLMPSTKFRFNIFVQKKPGAIIAVPISLSFVNNFNSLSNSAGYSKFIFLYFKAHHFQSEYLICRVQVFKGCGSSQTVSGLFNAFVTPEASMVTTVLFVGTICKRWGKEGQ